MAKTLIVHGHGKWFLNNDFTTTPGNVSVEFYTEGGKNQLTGFVYEYLLGSGMPLTGGEADSVIGPYRQTPDYTLSPLSREDADTALRYYNKGTLVINPDYKLIILGPGASRVKLSTFLKFADTRKFSKIVWLACRAVDLNDKGGRNLGFNAAQVNRIVDQAILDEHELEAAYKRLEAGYI